MNFPAISRWGDALLQALPTISNEDSGGVSNRGGDLVLVDEF